jgi:CheY-like chemotaxis protein
VDDDPDFLQLLSRMLRVCDSTLEVVTATSGEQALSELRDEVADLMLLDIVMPDMNGWELLEYLAHDERMKNVPTFCVSAQDLTDQPPVSSLLVATIGGGLSLSKLLRCSLEVSGLLLEPDAGLDLMPG